MTQQTPSFELTTGPLVSSAWLEINLDNPRVRILDVRGRHPSSALPHAKRAEYAVTHIPGAIFVDYEHDFVDVADPVPYQIASPSAFAQRARDLGIDDGDLIVTYDDYYGIFAARVAWAFRFHGAEARVLDGGWRTWVDEDRPRTSEVVARPLGGFTTKVRPALKRDLVEVAAASSAGAILVDARPRHLFLGEPGVAGSGHIPGAVSLPYQELVDGATGLFATPGAIARLLRGAGIDPARPPREVIATCGTGVSATVALIALELAGIHGAAVYDGSFSEWIANSSRPIAYGTAGRPSLGTAGSGRSSSTTGTHHKEETMATTSTRMVRKSLDTPDETRPFRAGSGKLELVNTDSGPVGRATFEPGWKWSEHVKPIAGTASCQASHVAYFISGRMKVVMDNGAEDEFGPGDLMICPPGHDAWIVGDDACVVVDWAGFGDYARPH